MLMIRECSGWLLKKNAFSHTWEINSTPILFPHFSDAEPVLCVLLVETVGIRRHDILRVAQEEVANYLAALVPSLVDTHRSVYFGPIPCR